jgi:hypothetical protein
LTARLGGNQLIERRHDLLIRAEPALDFETDDKQTLLA